MSGTQYSPISDIKVKSLKHINGLELEDYLNTFRWRPQHNQLLIGTADGQAALLDINETSSFQKWEAHPMGTLAVAWSQDGKYFATGGQDGKLRLYQMNQDDSDFQEITSCDGGGMWVEHLAWSPHQNLLASAAGKSLRIWDTQGQLLNEFEGHDNTIAGLGWHPNLEGQLATTSYNGLRRYRLGEKRPTRSFKWKGSSLKLFWSPDGKYIASATQDSTVHVWESKNGNDVQMPGYPVKPTVQAWDKNSRYLATGGSQDVVIWDFSGKGPAGSEPKILSSHSDYLGALAFQHCGNRLASGCRDGLVLVWDTSSLDLDLNQNQPEWICRLTDDAIIHLAWSHNDQFLAVAGESGSIQIYAIPE